MERRGGFSQVGRRFIPLWVFTLFTLIRFQWTHVDQNHNSKGSPRPRGVAENGLGHSMTCLFLCSDEMLASKSLTSEFIRRRILSKSSL